MRPLKIILAPDSFKETLTAAEVARAMAEGVRRIPGAIAEECPVADGGEGTMELLVHACGGEMRSQQVIGPMRTDVQARYGLIDHRRIGIVEFAEASGLALVPHEQRDPASATSFGTGQLLSIVAATGCSEILVCLGGSATIDGGAGFAQAAGFRFFDRDGCEITLPLHGGMLHAIARIEHPATRWPAIRVACDVTNPLCGTHGAAAVYGPQKGATPKQVEALDAALAHFARIAGGDSGAPGAGAAGGAGFGLMALFGAKLERGIELVLEAVHFHARCRDADLVITGEGRLDAQSHQGKACMGVARAASKVGVPTIAIVGSKGPGAEACIDPARPGLLAKCISLSERFGGERARCEAPELIADVAEEIARSLRR